jgi:hypothetical protein
MHDSSIEEDQDISTDEMDEAETSQRSKRSSASTSKGPGAKRFRR